jgi:hypothetical protein
MNKIFGVAIALTLVGLLMACVSPQGSGGTGGKDVQLLVNGRTVSMEELIKSPVIRQSVMSYVMLDTLNGEFSRRNLKLDQKKIDEEVQKQKDSAVQQGITWEEYLDRISMSEKDLMESLRVQQMFEGLVKAMANVTDEDVQKAWDKAKDQIISNYVSANHLPDSERAKLTFEDCKAEARRYAEDEASMGKQEEAYNMLIASSKLEIKGLASAEEAAEIVKQILGNKQDDIKKQEEAKKAAEQPQLAPPTAEGQPPAEGTTPPGGATPPPADSTPPPAEGTPPAGGGAGK